MRNFYNVPACVHSVSVSIYVLSRGHRPQNFWDCSFVVLFAVDDEIFVTYRDDHEVSGLNCKLHTTGLESGPVVKRLLEFDEHIACTSTKQIPFELYNAAA